MLSSAFVLSSLLAFATATPLQKRWNPAGYDTSRLGPDNANCKRQIYKLDITSENYVFTNVESNANESYLAHLTQQFVASLPAYSNFTQEFVNGNVLKNVSNTCEISGTLCEPKNRNGKASSTVQLLVHGIGFDSSYYDFSGEGIDDDYSYVYGAAQKGYTTFRYDRLGTGLSEHPSDAYNVVQAPTDLAILRKIAGMLRSGDIGSTAFDTIVGVGHSYGSVQLNALNGVAPTAVDHVVLTGFSANTSAVALYESSTAYSTATQVFPERFSADELTNAYLVTLAPQTNLLNFFLFPYYSQTAVNRARATEQPVTQGVLFSFGNLPGPAPSFSGKVHVVTGDKDWIFCLNNCYAVPAGSTQNSILDFVANLYPANSGFSTYIPANTGHAQFVHLSAGEQIQEIQNWLESNL